MLIDWFTVGAQALNFIILVWLLKRFLYTPILDAVDAREQRIAAELANAKAMKADAQNERDGFEHQTEVFAQQRAAVLSKAIDEAKLERHRLMDEARKAVDSYSVKRQETMRNDACAMNEAIGRRVQQEVFAIARRALSDLADTSLEERASAVFVRRLSAMDGETRDHLEKALKDALDPALLRSAFDLSGELQASIRATLNKELSSDVQVRFETAPELISGIELIVNGRKIAWSISDYLMAMEVGIGKPLNEKELPRSKPAEAPSKVDGPTHEPNFEPVRP